MIIQPNAEHDKRKLVLLQEDTELTPTEASGSRAPPSPFSTDAHTVNETTLHSTSTDVELGPPPEFTPYLAEQIEQSNRDIVSHDPHLNFDGEALYRFLLSQSQTPPTYRVHCCGKHDERRTRWVTERDSHGHSRMRTETYSETVVDFDFFIEVLPEVAEGRDPATWSVSDDEPAYRGKMVREYEGSSLPTPTTGSLRQKATRKQVAKYKAWVVRRFRTGLPPWIRQEDVERGLVDIPALSHIDGLKSSKTIRQWADEYCASPKYLKEFVYEKVLYGWDIDQLETAIRSTIKAVPYNGSLTVDITPHGSKVYIRPDNKVSRMLSNMWLKFLSIILLIFPFIWLFKRFHSRGGGRWEICGGAYPLKQWVPLDNGEEIPLGTEAASEELPIYSPIAPGSSSPLATRSRNSSNRFMQTPNGPKKLVGVREGEWFRAWEGTIRHAVIGRYQSNDPILPRPQSRPEVELLDGYNAAQPLIEY